MVKPDYIDIFTLCETCLDSSISDDEVHIDGYKIIRKGRNRHGGGVAIYIRDAILYDTTDIMDDFCDIEVLPIFQQTYRLLRISSEHKW